LRLITMTVADLCGRIGRRLAIAVTIDADPYTFDKTGGVALTDAWPFL